MFRSLVAFCTASFVTSAAADERIIDFREMTVGHPPSGFTSSVTGQGGPGDWKIIEDEVPPVIAPLSPNAPAITKRPVLAQLSTDPTDERFPLLIYNGEVFGDFTLTTRFKCLAGEKERMAGIAFRVQDEKNYYIVRASSLGNTFRFYKFVNGERSAPIGPEVSIPSGVWHELTINCKANQIRCSLNGKELIPPLTDNSFSAGKIAFWTKSDSVSHFADTRIEFTPREPLAQRVVRETMTRYPKLVGLKVYAPKDGKLQVIAASNEEHIGEAGTEVEEDILKNDKTYTARGKETIAVIHPLRDRNGDVVGVLRVTLKSFPGQTEGNALARSLPINKLISSRLQTARDMFE